MINETIYPMLAQKEVVEPFDDPEYLYEIKHDGARCLMYVDNYKVVSLQGREGSQMLRQFPEFKGLIMPVKTAILDGEIVVVRDGVPSLEAIQKRINTGSEFKAMMLAERMPSTFVAFDCLFLNDEPIIDKPLLERKMRLQPFQDMDRVRVNLTLAGHGIALFHRIIERGHEGLIAKRIDSPYVFGKTKEGREKRTGHWLKVKPPYKADCVILGYIEGHGHRERLGALVIGEVKEGRLIYRGKVGSGLTGKHIDLLLSRFKPSDPSLPIDIVGEKVNWVVPEIECKVRYFKINDTGHFRNPSFKGVIG